MSPNVTVQNQTKTAAERRATLRLRGPLGVSESAELREMARQALASGGGAVRLDWRGAEGVSTAALQILLALEADLRSSGRKLEPGPAPESVQRLLALGGLGRLSGPAKASAARRKSPTEEQESVPNGACG